MTKTVSANSGPIRLTSAHPEYNPLVVLNAITVSGTTDGVYGDTSLAWSITNQGTITASSGTGVVLEGGGTVTNSVAAALITGSTDGVYFASAGKVVNSGSIGGGTGNGVRLHSAGKVANNAGAHITGGSDGVVLEQVAGTVTNSGTIIGSGNNGIFSYLGGTVTNAGAASVITGGSSGVYSCSGAIAVTNQGSITGTTLFGVVLGGGGTVTNSGAAAHIAGGMDGIRALAAGTIANSGKITAGRYGVELQAGGSVTNSTATARITGTVGVHITNGIAATVANSGTISGTTTAVQFANADGNIFQVFPGAVETGAVAGGSLTDTLELGSTASVGTITGIGGQFTGFEVLAVDDGARWVVKAANTLAAGSTINLTGSASLAVTGTLTATGDLTIAGSGTLAAGGGRIEVGTAAAALANQILVDAGRTLTFTGNAALSAGLVKNKGSISGGVTMANSGTLNNSGLAATITGSVDGFRGTTGSSTIANTGTIIGTANYGVFIQDGGSVTNSGATALISGGAAGIYGCQGAITVTNQGSITGGTFGVQLYDTSSVTNSGSISGTGQAGVKFEGGGVVVNNAHADIYGSRYAVVGYNVATTLTNQGTLRASTLGVIDTAGVLLASGGTITNSGTASRISGGRNGVRAGGVATVINQGTLAGSVVAVAFADVDGNLLQEFPKAVTTGAVLGGSGTDTLELGSSASVGTIAGIGSQFTGFEVLKVDDGATWLMNGANSLQAGATIDLEGAGKLKVAGTLTAPGNLTITGSGTLAAAGGRIEVGTGGTALPNQIVIDAGRTLTTTATLSASVIKNKGLVAGGVLVNLAAATVTNTGSITDAAGNGVFLAAGGVVTNSGTGALISGSQNGVQVYNAVATVTNQGSINGTSGVGVDIQAGGLVSNGVGAGITGGPFGVRAYAGGATLTNQGTITSTGFAGFGVAFVGGGTVTNTGTSAHIAGGQTGVQVATGTVTNEGTITAGTQVGVLIAATGMVANNGSAASLSGNIAGVYSFGTGTVTNQGSIIGSFLYGVGLLGGGTVTNAAGGTISGGNDGVFFGGLGTVVTGGTLSGSAAVHFADVSGNLFQEFPGAVNIGAVIGGSGTDTLELGSAASTGTISGIGSAFTGFDLLAVDTGAKWQLAGSNTLAAGAAIALPGSASLDVTGTLTAQTSLTISGAGTLAAGGGRIEVGTAGTALANQIKIDPGLTLTTSGTLLASLLRIGTGALLVGSGAIVTDVTNSGTIEAKGGVLTLTGSLAGGALRADGGAKLLIEDTLNSAASVLNKGTVSLTTAVTLDVTGSIDPTSSGVFVLNNNSVLEIAKDTGFGNKISFIGPSGSTLEVDNSAQFGTNVGLATYKGPLLENFGGSFDAIDLKNLVFAGATLDGYTAATGLLQLHSGASLATLAFQDSSLAGSAFHIQDDGAGHVQVTHS